MNRPLDWLNYQHLLYFWMVAKSGTVGEAARQLHLTSPTVSSQIRKLEKSCGHELLIPRGRRLELTDAGRMVLQYAEQIFGLGSEMAEALSGRLPEGSLMLRVGVVDAVPKLIVQRLLTPLFDMQPAVRLQCSEGLAVDLLDQLVSHQLDVVLSDTAGHPSSGKRVFNHQLVESGTSFFAAATVLEGLGYANPSAAPELEQLLGSATLLLPGPKSALRRQLDGYFERLEISPKIAHEFSDTALMKVFGEAGAGIFPAPSVIAEQVCHQYSVHCVGQSEEIREAYFAVTAERQLRHPAVELLTETGQRLWPAISDSAG